MGIPQHLINLVRGFYENRKGTDRINNTISDEFDLEAGVRQVCVISPLSSVIISRIAEERESLSMGIISDIR